MTSTSPLSANEPARGQLGLVPNPINWFERAIESITRSKVHHVITATGDGRVISPEASGVIYRPVEHFPDAIWSAFPLTDAQANAVVGYGEAQIGKPYAWGDDILIGIDLLLGLHAPDWLNERIVNDGQWQCAELADAEYRAAGLPLFSDRSPAAVFPGSFAPIWDAHGWWPESVLGSVTAARLA